MNYSIRQHYGPRVDSASNINDSPVGKGGRCVGLPCHHQVPTV